MRACFTDKELRELAENSEKSLSTPEQQAEQAALICPFCRNKSFIFIGLLGYLRPAMFWCKICSFAAEEKDLTEKEKEEIIAIHFQKLIGENKRIQKIFALNIGLISRYKP